MQCLIHSMKFYVRTAKTCFILCCEILFLTEQAWSHGGLRTRELGQEVKKSFIFLQNSDNSDLHISKSLRRQDTTFEEGKWPFMRKIRRVMPKMGESCAGYFWMWEEGLNTYVQYEESDMYEFCVGLKSDFVHFRFDFFSVKTQSANAISKHSKAKFTKLDLKSKYMLIFLASGSVENEYES